MRSRRPGGPASGWPTPPTGTPLGPPSTGRQRFTASAAILPPPRTPSGRPPSGGRTLSPLLRLAEGDTEAAAGAIRRVVTETTDRLRRAKLLPAHVEIMLATNDISAAREAADELSEIVGVYDTPAQRAAAGCALGSVMLAEGEARPALGALRRAWEQWRALDAPYEAARARVLIGLACRTLGDEESAALELDAARGVFAELGAAPDLVRVEQLTRKQPRAAAHGLTPREQQVLRLVAAGKTNHAIAADLVIAEKTVDRHVTNIFSKLGVSSRAAATAYAYQHRLL
jgi:ATP/maltotriose-dependent transcriptional regulator MalT